MDVQFITIESIPIFEDNYIWLIINKKLNKVIAIDPGDAAPVERFLSTTQYELAAILITHHHFDHTNGLNALTHHYTVEVYGPQNTSIHGVTHSVKEPDNLSFPFLNYPISVLNIPGHTLDHIAYYWPGILFCGDTLFSAGCGRVFEGTMDQMFQSLQKIAALPPETKVYCTHEYTLKNLKFAQMVEPDNLNIQLKIKQASANISAHRPTLPVLIRDELNINPFLRCHVKEVIENVENRAGYKMKSALEVFSYLREWKNQF